MENIGKSQYLIDKPTINGHFPERLDCRYGLTDEQLQELLGRAGAEPNGLAFTVGELGIFAAGDAGDGWNPRTFSSILYQILQMDLYMFSQY